MLTLVLLLIAEAAEKPRKRRRNRDPFFLHGIHTHFVGSRDGVYQLDRTRFHAHCMSVAHNTPRRTR